MRYRFATLACIGLGLTASLLMTACSAEDKTIASTGGYKITKGEFDAKLETMPLAHTVLHNMLQQDLVFQYAQDNSISVSDAEIDTKINEIKQRLSDQQLADALKQQGMTNQDLRDLMKEQIIVKKAVDKGITVTDAQLRDYLNKNHATLDTAAQVRARHILVSSQTTANQIEAKLKGGADFGALAKQYSSDPGTKEKGGELGFFTQGAMVKEFSDAAFKLKPGQISQPVKSPYGWHVIQVEEVKAAQVATLANSQQKIKDQLLSSQEQMLVPQFMDKLLAGAKMNIADPQFADLFPSPPPSATPAAPAPTPKK